MEPALILANIGAVATTFPGLPGLFLCDKASAFVRISPIGPIERSEIAWLGASVGRVYSTLLDRTITIKNIAGIASDVAS